MANWWEAKVDENENTVWKCLQTAEGVDYYFNTITQATQWEKPDELMTDAERNEGDWFWIPDEVDAFVPAIKRRENKANNLGVVKWEFEKEDGSLVAVDKKDVSALKRSSLHPKKAVEDLTLLDDMVPPLILWDLKTRFEADKIYTNIGNILISINPYKWLPIYTHAVMTRYQQRGTEEREPHIFNIAHDAYVGLTEFKINQSIIVSGESGAGKTECAKQCLSYMASMAGSVGNVETKVLKCNPILEGFGNAKTVRNDNSSRFGKYMEVFFNQDWMIYASSTTQYLLEKIRVVQPSPDERNFHIFYQLTKAATAKQKKDWGLLGPDKYQYTAGGGCIDLPGVNDVTDFKDVEAALAELLFSPTEITQIFMAVAAVLSLGNVAFTKDAKDTVSISSASKDMLATAAKNIEVKLPMLEKSLMFRTLKIPGQKATDVPNTDKEASEYRHALAKFLYGSLFAWIVTKVNASMLPPAGVKNQYSIGILDIFGFEIFKENSFEQLCINFTNEMLQQHFNKNTFKLEQQLYRSEQIKFTEVEFIDNQPMIDLIMSKKPQGILPLLDEEISVPKGSDKGFREKVIATHAKNKVFKNVFKIPNTFAVLHYAGEVNYECTGFLDKNRDRLTDDLLNCVQSSSSSLLGSLFPPNATSQKDQRASLGSQFTSQLISLVTQLDRTEPHYVRCVKPNPSKAAMQFQSRMCYEQLVYSGVFEAVRIRKQGFPFRLKHQDFIDRYTCIVPDAAKAGSVKKSCDTIIAKLSLNKENIRTGSTMMLYRAEEHKTMELQRSIKVKSKEIEETLKRITSEKWQKYDGDDKEEFLNRLAKAVILADTFRIKTKVAEDARNLLDQFIQSRLDDDPECKDMLLDGEERKDIKTLEAALEMADERGFQACHLVRRIRELFNKLSAIDRILNKAYDELPMTWQTDACYDALEKANELEYFQPIYHKCQIKATRVDLVKTHLPKARAVLDENYCRAVLNAADELKFADSNTAFFQENTHAPKRKFAESSTRAGRIEEQHRSCSCHRT